MGEAILGLDAKFYIKPSVIILDTWAGTLPAGYNELSNIKDLRLGMEKAEADVSTRGTGGFRARKGTLKDGTIEFNMVWDPDDTRFDEMQTAFFDNVPIGALCLSSATGEGLWAIMDVMNFSRNEELEDALRVDVSLAVTFSTTPPEWVAIGVT